MRCAVYRCSGRGDARRVAFTRISARVRLVYLCLRMGYVLALHGLTVSRVAALHQGARV